MRDAKKTNTPTPLQSLAGISSDWALDNGILVDGAHYAIVTAAPIYHGVLVAVSATHYVLDGASWVVETGRLNEFVKDPAGVAQEAEFIGRVIVERSSVMAIFVTAKGEVGTK